MIRVHHLNNSRSQRVLWLLEELGVPYEITRYQRNKATMLAPDEMKRVHPLGKSPVIEDEGRTFAETGLIVEYLVERYGPDLAPSSDSDLHWRYRYWLHYAEGSAMPPLLLKLIFDRVKSGPMPFFVKPIARSIADRVLNAMVLPNLERNLDFMEGELGKSEWFAGAAFSTADIQMSFPLEAARVRGGLDERRPRLMAYLQKIHSRPAYLRALERGGKYELLR
jgi:glutathione S-transferase